jgi:hypothetical protein
MLRPLPVDLEELAGILEGDPLNAGGRIDLTTGEVWPQVAIQYALETGEEDEDSADDAERWLAVHNEGSREPYRLGPPPHPPRSPFQCRKLIGDIATAAHRAPPTEPRAAESDPSRLASQVRGSAKLRKSRQLVGRTYATGAGLPKRPDRWLVYICRADRRESFADQVKLLLGLLGALAARSRLPKLLAGLSERGIYGK